MHCSGWFSRPNDDHRGWRDVYAVFKEKRHAQSSLFLFDGVFDVNAMDLITLSLRPFEESVLYHMLKADFKAINASSIERRRNPQARNRRIAIEVNIERPQVRINQLTDE